MICKRHEAGYVIVFYVVNVSATLIVIVILNQIFIKCIILAFSNTISIIIKASSSSQRS